MDLVKQGDLPSLSFTSFWLLHTPSVFVTREDCLIFKSSVSLMTYVVLCLQRTIPLSKESYEMPNGVSLSELVLNRKGQRFNPCKQKKESSFDRWVSRIFTLPWKPMNI
jgi:hypothetical protein